MTSVSPPEPARRGSATALAVVSALFVLLVVALGNGPLWQLFRSQPSAMRLTTSACLVALNDAGQIHQPVAIPSGPDGCAGIHRLAVPSIGEIALSSPAIMSCPLTLSLNRFASDTLQPAAKTHFDAAVTEVRHLGAFSCRGVRGNPSVPSQHAFAHAVDIAGFTLSDGTVVTVTDHWAGDGPAGQFLRDVARRARRHFTTVLTPAFDASHANHFHFGHRPPREDAAKLAKALSADLYNSDERDRGQSAPGTGAGPVGTFPDTGEF